MPATERGAGSPEAMTHQACCGDVGFITEKHRTTRVKTPHAIDANNCVLVACNPDVVNHSHHLSSRRNRQHLIPRCLNGLKALFPTRRHARARIRLAGADTPSPFPDEALAISQTHVDSGYGPTGIRSSGRGLCELGRRESRHDLHRLPSVARCIVRIGGPRDSV